MKSKGGNRFIRGCFNRWLRDNDRNRTPKSPNYTKHAHVKVGCVQPVNAVNTEGEDMMAGLTRGSQIGEFSR